jgi:flagellar biosynthesis/type III secretory pathway protein FliH
MIDINELRQSLGAIQTEEVAELLARLEAAESDALEQARLNGMGSEREAALLSKLEVAEKAVTEAYQRGYATGQEEIEKERDELRAMIQVALVVLDEVCGNINPERGYADELETDVKRAIATLSLYNAKGE